ncbi:MAG: Patatin [Enterovirga sp.]|nr:Patatin [Enterovirga sp.]
MQEDRAGGRRYRDDLRSAFRDFFHAGDEDFEAVEAELEVLVLGAGETLVSEGDVSEEAFFLLSGRLRATRQTRQGPEILGDVLRGETVGELGLITGERRSASVSAVRDSVVARMSRETFKRLIAGRPEVALTVMRTVVERSRRGDRRRRSEGRKTICILPVAPLPDLRGFSNTLRDCIASLDATARLLTAEDFAALPRADRDSVGDPRGAVTRWLDGAEMASSSLLLVADGEPTPWTRACIRHSDEILLVADADGPVAVGEAEAALLDDDNTVVGPVQSLVLLHDSGKRSPTGTSAWLARRSVDRHIHVRPALERDMKRLARLVTGRAIGLVLSGGGARGFAHVGAINALTDAGIAPDIIGGTSIGSAIGALRALDLVGDDLIRAARRIFVEDGNPTSDYNLLPLISLLRGAKTRFLTERAVDEVAGHDIGIEDTWITYYCVAANYSTATESVLARGSLSRALLASFAIPGALPPIIIDGHLHVDGGALNNLPVDVMQRFGAARILAVDLLSDRIRTFDLDWVPGSLALFVDRLRGRSKRRYDLPSLPEMLVNASVLQATGRQREMRAKADICFRPALTGVRLLDWNKFDDVVRSGYETARADLAVLDPGVLSAYR